MLTEERREKIMKRVAALLRELDPDLRLHQVFLDSTRQQLALVMQKGEWPVVVGLSYIDYASHRDAELKAILEKGLQARQQAAQRREQEEESV